MTRHTEIVRLQSLSKTFDRGGAVLDNLNLTVFEGEFVALIGPSGCGKSTLLRLLSGLEEPTSGSALVEGRAPVKCDALSYVFQDATLLPWLTVQSNVGALLQLRKIPRSEIRQRSEEALDLVGLGDFAGYYPRQLSGGQKMRVSLARALTLHPRLLLLDEPFGALDEMTRDRLNEELLTIRDRRRWTAFFVTHSVAEAVFLSNRILVLSAHPGRIAHDLRTDLPYPRNDDLRRDDVFLQRVAEVSRLLRSVQKKELTK